MSEMDSTAFMLRLQDFVGAWNMRMNEPLSKHTTFKVGGPARYFVTPTAVDQIKAVVALCKEQGVPLHVLGLGSNVLVCDEGLPGVVMALEKNFSKITVQGTTVVAQAGASNAEVAQAALDAGLSGYEFASGIPGTVGGAATMNAGAYDGEFKDVCTSVACLTPEGEVALVPRAEADWSYRHSMMQDHGWLVLGVTLELSPADAASIKEKMDDLRQRRESKQPLEFGSAGSTFKRPEGYFAGKLIQDAGMRGHRVGDAQVSVKHCGFVINRDKATAVQVRQCIADVQEAVSRQFGVSLEPEVRMWGFDD